MHINILNELITCFYRYYWFFNHSVYLWIISFFIITHFQSNGYCGDLKLFWELLSFTNLLQWKLVILGRGDVHLNMIWTFFFFNLLFCFTDSNFKKYMDQANTHLSGNLQFQFSFWATYLWNTLYSIIMCINCLIVLDISLTYLYVFISSSGQRSCEILPLLCVCCMS